MYKSGVLLSVYIHRVNRPCGAEVTRCHPGIIQPYVHLITEGLAAVFLSGGDIPFIQMYVIQMYGAIPVRSQTWVALLVTVF
jgi:hypothetical protein